MQHPLGIHTHAHTQMCFSVVCLRYAHIEGVVQADPLGGAFTCASTSLSLFLSFICCFDPFFKLLSLRLERHLRFLWLSLSLCLQLHFCVLLLLLLSLCLECRRHLEPFTAFCLVLNDRSTWVGMIGKRLGYNK